MTSELSAIQAYKLSIDTLNRFNNLWISYVEEENRRDLCLENDPKLLL